MASRDKLNSLLRASVGEKASAVKDEELERFVVKLLAEEAEERRKKYSGIGVAAYMSDPLLFPFYEQIPSTENEDQRSQRKFEPNKRFLRTTLVNTTSHNQRLLKTTSSHSSKPSILDHTSHINSSAAVSSSNSASTSDHLKSKRKRFFSATPPSDLAADSDTADTATPPLPSIKLNVENSLDGISSLAHPDLSSISHKAQPAESHSPPPFVAKREMDAASSSTHRDSLKKFASNLHASTSPPLSPANILNSLASASSATTQSSKRQRSKFNPYASVLFRPPRRDIFEPPSTK